MINIHNVTITSVKTRIRIIRNYTKSYLNDFLEHIYDRVDLLIFVGGVGLAGIFYKLGSAHPSGTSYVMYINISSSLLTASLTVLLIDRLRAKRDAHQVRYSAWVAALDSRASLREFDLHLLQLQYPGFRNTLPTHLEMRKPNKYYPLIQKQLKNMYILGHTSQFLPNIGISEVESFFHELDELLENLKEVKTKYVFALDKKFLDNITGMINGLDAIAEMLRTNLKLAGYTKSGKLSKAGKENIRRGIRLYIPLSKAFRAYINKQTIKLSGF